MDLPCKNSKCGAIRILSDEQYHGGSTLTCRFCKTTFKVDLYCPYCPRTAEGSYQSLETPTTYIGGKTIQCPNGHKLKVPVTETEAHAVLGTLGSEISQYHQGERVKGLDPEVKVLVKGGYCTGVALDWIHRAMIGGKLKYENVEDRLGQPPTSDTERQRLSKEATQDRRAAMAATQQSAAKKRAFIESQNASFLSYMRSLENDRDIAKQEAAKKFSQAYVIIRRRAEELNVSVENAKDAIIKLNEIYNKELGRIQSDYDEKTHSAQKEYDAPLMQNFWREFAKNMDALIDDDRLHQGKVGPSLHKFGNLKVAKAVDPRTFNGVANFADALIHDGEFKPGRAAFVSLYPPMGGSGHAIAILRQNTGAFYLFDPNFGVYEFGAERVQFALVYLFLRAYPNFEGNTSDNHVFEQNGFVTAEYAIFESSQPTPPAVNITGPVKTEFEKKDEVIRVRAMPTPVTTKPTTQSTKAGPPTDTKATTQTGGSTTTGTSTPKSNVQRLRERFGN